MSRKRVFVYPTRSGFKAFSKRYAHDVVDPLTLVKMYAGFCVGIEHTMNRGKRWYRVHGSLPSGTEP